MSPLYFIELLREYKKELNFCKSSSIKIFNFWPLQKPDDLWLYLFIIRRKLLPSGKEVSLYSVFGDRFKMRFDLFRPKIFFTGENKIYRPLYWDHCLNDVQLSLGFEYIDHPRYLRFPLWYLYFIRPWHQLEDIKLWVDTIEENAHHISFFERKFCSMVAGHDPANTRGTAHASVSRFGNIDCAGKFMNNTAKLRELYGNDKLRFLQDYRYNIALENSDCAGYVTEKIFHTILAGTIPIYWGSSNQPEPEILNQDRILFYDPAQPDLLVTKMLSLQDEATLRNFFDQPVFKENAAEKIYERMLLLEAHIKSLF